MAKTKKSVGPRGGRPTPTTNRAKVVAEFQQAQARKERRGRLMLAGAAVFGVVIVAAAIVSIGLSGGKSSSGGGSGVASAAVSKAVTDVPTSVSNKVGAGTASGGPSKITAPALSKDGKPQVLYIGAEYCPYCAAERWPMTVALSRFGTWKHLGTTSSSSQDVFPSTATLSFHGATYTSEYLSFTGRETTTNKEVNGNYEPLDKLTAAEQALETKYDNPPYVSGQGGIPFIDLGGKFVSSGASYSPKLLQGKTHQQIASALSDPSDPISKAVNGTANVFTAALCTITDQKPASVCTASGVTTAAAQLKG